jgi:hypothetical protein
MEHLNKILEKLYNTLGNDYLTDNFDVEPFEFKVNVRKSDYGDDELYNYIVEVYSTPDLPKSFMYKGDEQNGIDISKLTYVFKGYVKYVDSSFGQFGKTMGVRFMNVQ